jgi:transposase
MIRAELDALSREELIVMVLAQAEQLAAVQATLAQLQADYAALHLKFEKDQRPPTTSRNSSQPPSRDQKANQAEARAKRKHGPPAGHVKYERKFVAEPDHVVVLKAAQCACCATDLQGQAGELVDVNQITEVPPAQAEVIEVRQYAVTCPACGQTALAQPPAGLEMSRSFGARLESLVIYYRQEQHLGYERTQTALWNLHGVTISQGGIDQIMQRAGQQAVAATEPLQQAVQASAVVNSDETSARVDGRNWWEWVFCAATAVLHVIKPSRGADVIAGVMGTHCAEVWGSDCWSAQLKAPAQGWQLCLAHQLRNLQAVVDRDPSLFWAPALQALFRYAIHVHHQRDQLPAPQFAAQVARIAKLCDWLLARPVTQPEALRLQKRYRKHRQHLFVFLERTDVAPTNNVSERALRASVVHRKVSGGFRSQWGAEAYAALASIIDTAALKGTKAFEALRALMGPPALPLPAPRE